MFAPSGVEMSVWQKVFLFLAAMSVLCSCSTAPDVRETLPPVVTGAAVDQMEKVVVLPLTDRMSSASAYTYASRGETVDRILHEELYRIGFYPVPRDDVLSFLSEQGIVQLYGGVSSETLTLQSELRSGDWSETMQRELIRAIEDNRQADGLRGEGVRSRPGSAAMDHVLLSKLGSHFAAAYVLSGGVSSFGIRWEESFDPLQIGLFPLLFKSGGRTLFGAIDLASYGAQEESPLPAAAAGRVPNATVNLWLRAQDSETGETFWMNRVEVRSKAHSIYHVPERNDLFDASVRRAAASLLEDFFQTAVAYRNRLQVVREELEGGGRSEDAMGALEAAEEARRASQEAKEAARDAARSAEKAEAIFEKVIVK